MTPPEAPQDCTLCPRLVTYREEVRAKHPDWYNGAVQSFGDDQARLLILGLAPGVGGAHRTGRPFTGDYAGDLLYATMGKFGFASGTYQARPDDGVTLHDAMITNAVRCVPPQNKPIAAEVNACRPFMLSRIDALPQLRAILCLGRIAHDTLIRGMGARLAAYPFGHQAQHQVGDLTIFDSYHCSRYNTNTGVLTTEMFEAVFADIRTFIDQA